MPTSTLTINGHYITSASIITSVWELFPLKFKEPIKDTCLGEERNEEYFAHEVKRRKDALIEILSINHAPTNPSDKDGLLPG